MVKALVFSSIWIDQRVIFPMSTFSLLCGNIFGKTSVGRKKHFPREKKGQKNGGGGEGGERGKKVIN